MTDNTEKDVLTNPEECGWTDKEIDAFIAEDVLIEMKCIKCGHIAKVPDWILGEFAGENKALGKDGEVEIECPRCNGAMRRLK